MLTNLSSILTAVIDWVGDLFGVISGNQFLMVFVLLGLASMLVAMVLTLIRGLRK